MSVNFLVPVGINMFILSSYGFQFFIQYGFHLYDMPTFRQPEFKLMLNGAPCMAMVRGWLHKWRAAYQSWRNIITD